MGDLRQRLLDVRVAQPDGAAARQRPRQEAQSPRALAQAEQLRSAVERHRKQEQREGPEGQLRDGHPPAIKRSA